MNKHESGKAASFSRILVLRLSSIGDIVLTIPLLRHLSQRFPRAKVDFVIKKEFSVLMKSNPYLNHLLIVDKAKGWAGLRQLKKEIKSRDYDLILDVHNNPRTRYLTLFLPGTLLRYKKYRVLRWLLIKFKINRYERIIPVHQRYLDTIAQWTRDIDSDLEFPLDPEAAKSVSHVLTANSFSTREKHVALIPGAGFDNKRWPVEYYAGLARMLSSQNWRIWLLGSPNERSLGEKIVNSGNPDAINLIGKLELMQSASVIARMNVVVSNDSGLMHIADALNVPVVAIFGPTTRELGFYPVNSNSHVIEHEYMPCRPCTHMGAASCPKGHFRCMMELTPDMVFAKIKELQ